MPDEHSGRAKEPWERAMALSRYGGDPHTKAL